GVVLEVDDAAAVAELGVRPELVLAVDDPHRPAELRAHLRLVHAERDAGDAVPDPDRRRGGRRSENERADEDRDERDRSSHERRSTMSGLECGYLSVRA